MKMHIREFAYLTGVSVRTLHYYDEIGLLKPASVDEQNGYRFYDEASLERMQEIMFYRELDFPLKTIFKILASPNYDKKEALMEQKHLLTLKKERLERLIEALEGALKGETMSMNVFDNSEFKIAQEKYEKEAKEKWGNTDAYKESTEKYAGYSDNKWSDISSEMVSIIAEFSDCMSSGEAPASQKAQVLVKSWQDFISENHYTCTKEILSGLGQMYTADERFASSIDKHHTGTAKFMASAIKEYCK